MTNASDKSKSMQVRANVRGDSVESGRDALDNVAELSSRFPSDVVQGIYDEVVLSLATKAGLTVKISGKYKAGDSKGNPSDS